MVVVAIIGLLAAIALPAMAKARSETRVSRYLNDLRLAVDSLELYAMEHHDYPPDVNPAQVPAGMEPYLARFDWTAPTAIGGRWDWDHNSVGITAGVTVIGPGLSLSDVQKVDQRIDDGNLLSGRFRRTAAGGYSYVIVD